VAATQKDLLQKMRDGIAAHPQLAVLRSQTNVAQRKQKRCRVICVCQGGNSRSVACAYVLKYEFGIDALACSWEKNSPETMALLFRWATIIIVMQAEFKPKIPARFHGKVLIIDVGPDKWCNGLHPELVELCYNLLAPHIAEVAA
jgi:predicted protein tyrosine phosphatase